MAKLRVYELAKELKLSSKQLLDVIERLNFEPRSHMSTMSEEEVLRVREYVAGGLKPAAKGILPQKKEAAPPAPKAPERKGQAPVPKAPEKRIPPQPAPAQRVSAQQAPAPKVPPQQAPARQNQGPGPKGRDQARGPAPKAQPHKAPALPPKPATRPATPVVTPGKDEEEGFVVPRRYEEQPRFNQIKKKPTDPRSRKGRPEDFKSGKKSKGRFKPQGKRPGAPPPPPPVKRKVTMGETIVVQELAKRLGKTAAEVIKKLLELGLMATINQEIDADIATIVATDFGATVEIKSTRPKLELAESEDNPEDLRDRPPVVTVLGHVDHGKTSLLDAIRRTNVTAQEAGGITQHIGAYQVEVGAKRITFVDTPGHEAFTAMRARGAQVTDIAILVIAADEGVMPQTVEALNHAKAAGVPIIVALNKMDKPGANPDRVKQQLTEHGLVAEEWGGETIMVPVSAVNKEGLDTLLEMILLVAEMSELKANPHRNAAGVVVESQLDRQRGPIATVLVQKGTLNVGDSIVAGTCFGRVRAMMDHQGKKVSKAGPATPVAVLGFSELPQAGSLFQVAEEEKLAREVAGQRQQVEREKGLQKQGRVSLDDLFKQLEEGVTRDLNLILKADTNGSLEALKQSLEKLSTSEVRVNAIHGGVGAVTESDVDLASASNAIIIGFNVRPETNARRLAENEKIDIRLYRVIYEALDEIEAAMAGLLQPTIKEVILGQAEVRELFKVPKAGTIAGCYIIEGKITHTAKVRIIRDGTVIHEGEINSLRRFKQDVKEVAQGYECGIGIENFQDIKQGDIIEAYVLESVKREHL